MSDPAYVAFITPAAVEQLATSLYAQYYVGYVDTSTGSISGPSSGSPNVQVHINDWTLACGDNLRQAAEAAAYAHLGFGTIPLVWL